MSHRGFLLSKTRKLCEKALTVAGPYDMYWGLGRNSTPMIKPEPLRRIAGLIKLTFNERRQGVYFLCQDSIVIYVGQSRENNVVIRVGQHVRGATGTRKKNFDSVFFLPCPGDRRNLDATERFYIRELQPKYNGLGDKFEPLKQSRRNKKMAEAANLLKEI